MSETSTETRSEQASTSESSPAADGSARSERGDLNDGGSVRSGSEGEGAGSGTRSEQGSEQRGDGGGDRGTERSRETMDQATRGERGSLTPLREGPREGAGSGRAADRDGGGDRGDTKASDKRHDTYIGNSDSPRPPAQQSDTSKAEKQRDAGQSRKPEAGPDKSEPNQSRMPKEPMESKKPPDGPNRSDGGNGVVVRHPLGPGRHDGRGATGPGGHGLDKNPDTKDWATKAAKDMKAAPGTAVKAMTDGKIVRITEDNRPDKTGKVYGDQVTIVSSNGAVKTFYTHINASQEIKDKLNASPSGIEVHRGDTIGTVAKWGDNPSESHLHVGMAARGADGGYHGVDPSAALSASRDADRDLTVTPDGGYIVGDNKYSVPESAPGNSSGDRQREVDREDTPGATRR